MTHRLIYFTNPGFLSMEKNGNTGKLLAIVAILAGVAVGLGAYYLYDGHKRRQAETAVENARLDSIAAAERAYRDSVTRAEEERARREAEEQARQKRIDETRIAYESVLRQASAKIRDFGWKYYFMFDFNSDALPELCVVTATCEADAELNIYGMRNGKLKRLYSGAADHCAFYDNGTYILRNMGHSGYQLQEKIYGDDDGVKAVTVYEHEIPIERWGEDDYRNPTGQAVDGVDTDNFSLLHRTLR